MSYLMRSEENALAIQREMAQAAKPSNQGKKAPCWESPRPGDVIVSIAFDAVYVLAKDGSRRRCRDPKACGLAVDHIKVKLAEIDAKKSSTLGKYDHA